MGRAALSDTTSTVTSISSSEILRSMSSLSRCNLSSPSGAVGVMAGSSRRSNSSVAAALCIKSRGSSADRCCMEGSSSRGAMCLVSSSYMRPFAGSLGSCTRVRSFPTVSGASAVAGVSMSNSGSCRLSGSRSADA